VARPVGQALPSTKITVAIDRHQHRYHEAASGQLNAQVSAHDRTMRCTFPAEHSAIALGANVRASRTNDQLHDQGVYREPSPAVFAGELRGGVIFRWLNAGKQPADTAAVKLGDQLR